MRNYSGRLDVLPLQMPNDVRNRLDTDAEASADLSQRVPLCAQVSDDWDVVIAELRHVVALAAWQGGAFVQRFVRMAIIFGRRDVFEIRQMAVPSASVFVIHAVPDWFRSEERGGDEPMHFPLSNDTQLGQIYRGVSEYKRWAQHLARRAAESIGTAHVSAQATYAAVVADFVLLIAHHAAPLFHEWNYTQVLTCNRVETS